MTSTLSTFPEAVELLRQRGIVLRQLPAEYLVNYRSGGSSTEYRTDELQDAVAHGLTMEIAAGEDPPPGPVGRSWSRRAEMYRHNRKLAARRAGRAGRGKTR